MTTKLNNQFYFVAPLEVVKVTKDNLEEAAQWCGGRVAEVKSRTVADRMDSYVWVPTPKGTKMSWAFPGMFITRRIIVTLKNELAYSYQVYKRDYFEKNYFGLPNEAVEKTWERADAEKRKAQIAVIAEKRKPKSIDMSTLMGTKVLNPDDMITITPETAQAISLVGKELGGQVIATIPNVEFTKPDHADGTGSVTNHVSKMVEGNEAAAEEGP